MYRVFEHTADIGLHLEATTRDELFVEAARGLVSLLIDDPAQLAPLVTLEVTLSAAALADLLCDWLSELVFRFETERFLPVDFEVRTTETSLRATLRGQTVDPTRQRLGREVKAVTYHGLVAGPVDGGWQAEVILDI